MLSVGLKFSYMMKKEAFFWPFSGLFKAMGGIPIDRSKKTDITTQMAEWFAQTDKAMLGITPEGTRKKVNNFKKGYLRIAYAAEVPIFIIGINGATKEVILDKIVDLTYDLETDNKNIKDYIDQTFIGINPENG